MSNQPTRKLLAIEASHLSARRASGRTVDDTYVHLLMALSDAASDYDAASDGAFHHSDSRTADARYYEAKRAYDKAGRAFADYARELN